MAPSHGGVRRPHPRHRRHQRGAPTRHAAFQLPARAPKGQGTHRRRWSRAVLAPSATWHCLAEPPEQLHLESYARIPRLDPAIAQAAHTHPPFVSPIARSPKRVLRDHAAKPAAAQSILEKRPRVAGACEREQRRANRAAGEWRWIGVLAVQLNAVLVLVLSVGCSGACGACVALRGRVRTNSVGVLRCVRSVRDEPRS